MIYCISSDKRSLNNKGGVEKHNWYLEQAIGCELITPGEKSWSDFKKGDIIIGDGYFVDGFDPSIFNVISIVHGAWKEFSIRNEKENDFRGEWLRQDRVWKNPHIKKVAVSQSAAKYLEIHHGVKADKIILNSIDTDLFKPIEHYNSKPVVIYAANDYNKDGHGKLGQIAEILKNEFEFRYLNAKIGEEHIKFAQGDLFIQTSRYEGNSYACILPDTLIKTPHGNKKIKDMKIGDFVLTHTGKYCCVGKVMNRFVNEEIFNIKCNNNNSFIGITSNHPLLGIKTHTCDRFQYKNSHSKNTICKDNCKEYCSKKYYKNYKLEWINPIELKVSDVIAYPKYKIEKDTIIIDLAFYLNDTNIRYDNLYVWTLYSNKSLNSNITAETISKKMKCSKHEIYYVTKCIRRKIPLVGELQNNVKDEINRMDYMNCKNLKINRKIIIDENFMSLLGYFISEGWATKSSVNFAFNTKEICYHNDVIRLMKTVFNLDLTAKRKTCDNGCCLQFNSSVVSKFFEKLCGNGARNKFIPLWIVDLPNFKLIPMIRSMWKGDGSFSNNNFIYSSVSSQLLCNTKLILSKLNIIASHCEMIRKNTEGINYTIGAITIFGTGAEKFKKILDDDFFSFREIPNKRKRNQNITFSDENYIFNRVLDIKKTLYNGLVYNLEVEHDNSYVANDMIVHNCNEAMSCGLPIIASRTGLFEGTQFDIPIGEIVDWNASAEEFAKAVRYVWSRKSKYNPRMWVKNHASYPLFKEAWTSFIKKVSEN